MGTWSVPDVLTGISMSHSSHKKQYWVLRVFELLHEIFEVYRTALGRKGCSVNNASKVHRGAPLDYLPTLFCKK